MLAFHLYVVCQTLTSALPGQDKTNQEQDQAKQENTRHDKTRQNITGLKICFARASRFFCSGVGEAWGVGGGGGGGDKTRHDKTGQDKTR